MLHLNMSVLTRTVKHAQLLAASQPAWVAAITHAAQRLVRNRRRISVLADGSLCMNYMHRGPYVVTPESCSCVHFQRCHICEHRVMAEVYQRYCEALAAQPLGAAD